jgi:hypothetical protein
MMKRVAFHGWTSLLLDYGNDLPGCIFLYALQQIQHKFKEKVGWKRSGGAHLDGATKSKRWIK